MFFAKKALIYPMVKQIGLSILSKIKTQMRINLTTPLTPPHRLSSYDDGKENAAHPYMMICRLRRNVCIEERCQKGKEDLSQASFKYTHFAVAGKLSYEDEQRSLRHHHMMISDAEGLKTGYFAGAKLNMCGGKGKTLLSQNKVEGFFGG